MRKGIIIQGGPPNRAQEEMDIINEEVLNDVGGQWTFIDVGGGRHVPHNQLDPFKNWGKPDHTPKASQYIRCPPERRSGKRQSLLCLIKTRRMG